MKGGAVIDERSPDTDVRLKRGIEKDVQVVIRVSTHDLRNEDQLPRCAAGTAWIEGDVRDHRQAQRARHYLASLLFGHVDDGG